MPCSPLAGGTPSRRRPVSGPAGPGPGERGRAHGGAGRLDAFPAGCPVRFGAHCPGLPDSKFRSEPAGQWNGPPAEGPRRDCSARPGRSTAGPGTARTSERPGVSWVISLPGTGAVRASPRKSGRSWSCGASMHAGGKGRRRQLPPGAGHREPHPQPRIRAAVRRPGSVPRASPMPWLAGCLVLAGAAGGRGPARDRRGHRTWPERPAGRDAAGWPRAPRGGTAALTICIRAAYAGPQAGSQISGNQARSLILHPGRRAVHRAVTGPAASLDPWLTYLWCSGSSCSWRSA